MKPIVLLVLFVIIMAIWGLILLGAIAGSFSGWLPFAAVLLVGIAVFAAKGP